MDRGGGIFNAENDRYLSYIPGPVRLKPSSCSITDTIVFIRVHEGQNQRIIDLSLYILNI